jgi:hypothetical protein
MTVYIGKLAPDFTAKAVMPDDSIDNNFNLKTYLFRYKLIKLKKCLMIQIYMKSQGLKDLSKVDLILF